MAGRDDTQLHAYDLMVRQLIPGYASLARLSVALLAASPLAATQGARVLVAGCGTGAELVEAHRQRPDWELTALDPAEEMLSEARKKLAPADRDAIHWHQSTVEALPAGKPYAGALSVLVLQSLPDDGSKLTYLRALAQQLAPGGQLVLIDLMRAQRPSLQAQVERAWLGFQQAAELPLNAPEIAPLTEAMHPIGVSRLTALVNAAGFSDPARIFQALDYEGFLLQRCD
ncbi:MAG: class I SAM-dependent methyltransferase [Cyanobacteriota bacterium]